MATQTMDAQNTAFKIGWIVLLALSGLWTLGHIALAFAVPDEATLFIGWAAFNLYATLVIYIPFRRGERWAWYTTWILVMGLASAILFNATIGLWYVGTAAVMALCLLLTRPAFFQKGDA